MEKKVFAWTAAQLEFLAEEANKTPWLNTVLAQLLDRGEQAIQKFRTKTKYRQAEIRVDKSWLKIRSRIQKQHQEQEAYKK